MKIITLAAVLFPLATLRGGEEPTFSSLQTAFLSRKQILTREYEQASEALRAKYVAAMWPVYYRHKTAGEITEALAILREIQLYDPPLKDRTTKARHELTPDKRSLELPLLIAGASASKPKNYEFRIRHPWDDSGDGGLHIRILERESGKTVLSEFTKTTETARFLLKDITSEHLIVRISATVTNGNEFWIGVSRK